MDSRVRNIKTYTVKLCKDWSEKPAWWAPNERKEIKKIGAQLLNRKTIMK